MNSVAAPLSKRSNGTVAGAEIHADAESQAWIDGLDPRSDDRNAAIDALHALLLEATRFEVKRRAAALAPHTANGRDAIALQSADDALAVVLSKLDDFQGRSRFTTWASKFALAEAARQIHRFEWLGRTIPAAGERRTLLADEGRTEHRQTAELSAALDEAIQTDLSPSERHLLVAATLNDVPLDVLAERHGTTRSALYRTIRDARQKLRTALSLRGFSVAKYMEANNQ